MFAFRSKEPKQLLFTGRLLSYLLVLICALVLTTSPTFAQGSRGTISGEVTDPTGAVVSGAAVKLIKSDNQQEVRSVTTNDSGVYQFLEIDAGTYELVITATGFAETHLKEAALEPNRALRLDAHLTLGGTTEEVTVTAAQEILDRDTPTLGTSVESRRVLGLPLNGRNILDLALGQPGVTTIAVAPGGTGTAPFGAGLGIRVNGQRGTENNITLDGANNNETAVGGSTGFQPRPDAVQEFRLLTSNYESEFGRNTGSVITVVTRGGNNDFHGNARFFYRPTVLSAARFFDQNQASDKPRPGTIDDFRRRFERKEFGFNIGGPIYLPKFGEGGPSLWSGRDKTFFFFDYEGRRQLIGDTRQISQLPTAAERAGQFNHQIIDPATGAPFPGNLIPQNRISPIARYYLQFLPVPSSGNTASVGANEVENFNIFTARVDHMLNNSQTLNFTVNYFDRAVDTPFAFGGANVPGFGSVDLRTTFNFVARHTYTISPSVVNSFLASYARNDQPSVAPKNHDSPASIGFSPSFTVLSTFAGPPNVRLLDRGLNLGNTIQGPQARVAENFQIQDSLSWSTGNHRYKFGFDGVKYKQDQLFLFINQGIFSYASGNGQNNTGDDLADLLIGNGPVALQLGSNGERDFRQDAGALFAQDNWRIRDNVSLSLGVRYEYNAPLTDKANRVAYYRPGQVSTLLTAGFRGPDGVLITTGPGGRAPRGLVYVGDPDSILGGTVPDGGVKKDWNNFAPRVGIAWSPKSSEGSMMHSILGNSETVIRAGFGVFYGAIIGDTALQQLSAPGYQGTNAFFFPASGTLADPFAPDPFPLYGADGDVPNQGQLVNPFLAAGGPVRVTGPQTQFSRSIDPNIRTPYTYQYNLTVERAFRKNYVASIAYVGNRGKKLYALEQINPAVGTFIPVPAGRVIAAPSAANVNTRRLNDDFRLGISQMVSAGTSFYDSLQAQIQRRYDNGLLFQVAYTYSKSISNSDTLRDTLDLVNRTAGKSLSAQDVPHRFTATALYDLPFFKSGDGIGRYLLGGWNVGGIYSYQSGSVFSVANPTDINGAGGAILSNADLGLAFQNLNPRTNDGRAFNIDAFRRIGAPITNPANACPGSGFPNNTCIGPNDPRIFNMARDFRRGTAGFNQFRLGNTVNNFDLILAKNTKLGERMNMELRFEAFNALNHTQFTTVDLSLGGTSTCTAGPGVGVITGDCNRSANANFGKYQGARESRVIQLGARFSF